ncbi:MAG: hypothetical protein Fur0026_00700 [Sideroxydans sp.]
MLIQNISGGATQALQPPRHTSDGAHAVVARIAIPDPALATPADLSKATTPKVTEQATAPKLQGLVDNINHSLKQANKNLEFTIDTDTKKSIVKLVDTETGEVIRQFPSEETLAISKAIEHMQQGMLLKQKA